MKRASFLASMVLVVSVAVIGPVQASQISMIEVKNASFESADVAGGTHDEMPTSWTQSDTYWTGVGDITGMTDIAAPLDGTNQFLWANGGGGTNPTSGVYQVLSAVLQANTTYTLTVDVGYRNGLLGGGVVNLGYGSTPNANLLVASSVVNAAPSGGNWATWTSTFVTGDAPAGLGQALRVDLFAGNGIQTLFDNVRLSETVPEPTGVALCVSACLGLLAYAWRKRK